MFVAGIVELELGLAGVGASEFRTGAGGIGVVAVAVCEPGKTMVLES